MGGESSFQVLERVGGGAGRRFVLRRGAIFCTWAEDFFFGLWYITSLTRTSEFVPEIWTGNLVRIWYLVFR